MAPQRTSNKRETKDQKLTQFYNLQFDEFELSINQNLLIAESANKNMC